MNTKVALFKFEKDNQGKYRKKDGIVLPKPFSPSYTENLPFGMEEVVNYHQIRLLQFTILTMKSNFLEVASYFNYSSDIHLLIHRKLGVSAVKPLIA